MKYDNHTPPPDPSSPPRILPWPGAPARENPPHLDLLVGPCVDLARRVRPCFGPRGLAKSLLFRFPRGFSSHPVSSPDTTSVLTHMKLEDPQVLTLASAASTQAQQHGDGAVLVLLLASSLLSQARDLMGLGVTGAEIQAGYRQACGRALVLLEGMGCGQLEEPREELQVRGILRSFLASWQPGFEALLEGVVARSCVHSWRPLTSGVRGEVWEGVTFDPSCVKVCMALDRERTAPASVRADGEMDRDGETVGEEKTEALGEAEEKKEKEEEGPKTRDEDVCSLEKEEKKKRNPKEDKIEIVRTTKANVEKEVESEDKESGECLKEDQTDIKTKSQDKKGESTAEIERRDTKKRNGALEQGIENSKEEEEEEEEEDRALDDWVDLGLEIWATSLDEDGVVWTEEVNEKERVMKAEKIDGLCKDPLSVNIHGSVSKLIEHFSTERQMHKHITSVHSVQHKRRLHRPKGCLNSPASRPASYHYHHSPRKAHPSPWRAHPSDPRQSPPLQASVVVEEPLDGEACSKVTVTLRSPDQTLLDSAQGAVAASLRVYHSLLVDPRVVPGAGASEAGLALGLTGYGLGLVGMEQLVVHAFAQALLVPVKTLGENAGTPAELAVVRSYWGGRGEEVESMGLGVVDALGCKASAIQKATEASLAILTDLLDQRPEEEDRSHVFYQTPVSTATLLPSDTTDILNFFDLFD